MGFSLLLNITIRKLLELQPGHTIDNTFCTICINPNYLLTSELNTMNVRRIQSKQLTLNVETILISVYDMIAD